MMRDRMRRLKDWTTYEQEREIEKCRFRQEEMLRGIRDIAGERTKLTTPELLTRHNAISFQEDASSGAAAPKSSRYLATMDPRLLSGPGHGGRSEVAKDLPLNEEESFWKARQASIDLFSVTIAPPPSSPDL